MKVREGREKGREGRGEGEGREAYSCGQKVGLEQGQYGGKGPVQLLRMSHRNSLLLLLSSIKVEKKHNNKVEFQ